MKGEASSRLKPLKGSEDPRWIRNPKSPTAKQIKARNQSSSQAENRVQTYDAKQEALRGNGQWPSEKPFCAFEKKLKYLIGLHVRDLGFLYVINYPVSWVSELWGARLSSLTIFLNIIVIVIT